LESFAPALYSAETRFIRMNPAPCRIAEDPAVPRLMKVTAYCPCDKCCGKYADGKTATNDDAYVCDGVAADFSLLPKRTVLEIPGAGVKEVDDTGGAMRRAGRENPPVYHIDLRFPAHEQALAWGVKWLDVEILLPPEL
jgi:3D (Asp-Asp-Asp) domain-containing protein